MVVSSFILIRQHTSSLTFPVELCRNEGDEKPDTPSEHYRRLIRHQITVGFTVLIALCVQTRKNRCLLMHSTVNSGVCVCICHSHATE